MADPRIYHAGPLQSGLELELDPRAAHHVGTVLRLRSGATLRLFNGDGSEYRAEIVAAQRRNIRVRIDSHSACATESPLHTTLALAVSKGDRMDYAIQKAVELGVNRIVPLLSSRAVRLTGERREKKLVHWQGVATAAAEQCGRCVLPTVEAVTALEAWLAREEDGAVLRLLLDPHAERANLTEQRPERVELLVGPEGGLSETECDQAISAGYRSLLLGPRILRTETAPLVALAALQQRYGDIAI